MNAHIYDRLIDSKQAVTDAKRITRQLLTFPIAFRPSSPKEAENGPYDDGAANGLQAEVRRSDSNDDRRVNTVKGHRVARGLLLRAIRRGSRSESEVRNSIDTDNELDRRC